ncbi:MAG: glycerophosphodiester phosphodiesterase family protein [Rhodovibrio sp.]|nr:glycerophosphodiester phosphodiesterase family protein [Rhodovibrio sp.]
MSQTELPADRPAGPEPRIALPPVIGHRGAAGLAPENTLPGLRAAAEAGCRSVEVDVMLAACGTPMLHHDVSLQRIEGVDGRLDRWTARQLAELDAGASFAPAFAGTRIPTLAEALAEMLRLDLHPNLEIKPAPGAASETARAAVATVREVWPADRARPLISSFQRDCLTAARAAAPELPRGLIARARPWRWRAALTDLDCVSLHLAADRISPADVRETADAGWAVAIYTVNDGGVAARLRGWGAHAIITDRPDLMPQAL